MSKYRQGIVEHQKLPRFVTLSVNNTVHFNADQSPTIVTFAHGSTDYLLVEDVTILNAWEGPFINNTDYWLYWDIDLVTSERTFGQTEIEPGFGETRPLSPSVDQHFFDLIENKMFVWDGIKWTEKIRVFAGTVKDLVLNPMGNYSQINLYGNFDSEVILIDRFNRPVSKFVDNGTKEFVTNTTSGVNTFDNISTFTYGKLIEYYGIATEPIPKNKCVCWDVNRGIKLASPEDVDNPSFGVTEKALEVGEVGKVITHGFLKNRNDWIWSEPENTSIFVGDNGDIVTTPSQVNSSQKIGYIASPNTIFLDFGEQILIDP